MAGFLWTAEHEGRGRERRDGACLLVGVFFVEEGLHEDSGPLTVGAFGRHRMMHLQCVSIPQIGSDLKGA